MELPLVRIVRQNITQNGPFEYPSQFTEKL
jgi:hypothetical protein